MLSTTIAWMMRDLHRLGGFFFFNPDILERSARKLITTLSCQLAELDAHIGAAVSSIVEGAPHIPDMHPQFQFDALLSAKALQSVDYTRGSIIIVIDALDESGSEADQKPLMQALLKGLSSLPSFLRIMVVSQPERDIEAVFGSHSHVCPYPLDIDSAINKHDVSKFVRYCLGEIRTDLMSDGCVDAHWPGKDKIKALATRAGGLFIWASTACLYIESYNSGHRLSELIGNQSESNSSGPFAQLDLLYKTGIQSAGLWSDLSFCSDCCGILGVILCVQIPVSHSVIDSLLKLPHDRSSRWSVSRLKCILRPSDTEGIRILHPSFYNYLSKRCSGEPWSADLKHHNGTLAVNCIKLQDGGLQENICDMTLPNLTQHKPLPEAIAYASQFWIEHTCLISDIMGDILNQIYNFLSKHLLHWMEVLALLKCHDRAIISLQHLIRWVKVRCLSWGIGTSH